MQTSKGVCSSNTTLTGCYDFYGMKTKYCYIAVSSIAYFVSSVFSTSTNPSSYAHQRVSSILNAAAGDVVGSTVTVRGWLRTARSQKTLRFLQVHDGSALATLQVVVPDGVEVVNDDLSTPLSGEDKTKEVRILDLWTPLAADGHQAFGPWPRLVAYMEVKSVLPC